MIALIALIAFTPSPLEKTKHVATAQNKGQNSQKVEKVVQAAVEAVQPTVSAEAPVVPPEPETPPVASPAPVAEPPAPVASGNCDLANNYDWPVATARAVCLAESGGNNMAANWNDHHGSCSGSFSLMQVGCFWYPYYGYSSNDYYNGSVNMEIAHNIWARQGGFGAWTAYTSGKYLRYL